MGVDVAVEVEVGVEVPVGVSVGDGGDSATIGSGSGVDCRCPSSHEIRVTDVAKTTMKAITLLTE